jgi:hypothetical protein
MVTLRVPPAASAPAYVATISPAYGTRR